MSTSSSYVQREQSSSYVSNSRNNYGFADASRVRAHGDGLLRAYRNEKATFTVDTRDSGMSKNDFLISCLTNFISLGNGMLMVGVFGPKYPCEEVFVKHVGNNQYNVQYVRIVVFL